MCSRMEEDFAVEVGVWRTRRRWGWACVVDAEGVGVSVCGGRRGGVGVIGCSSCGRAK